MTGYISREAANRKSTLFQRNRRNKWIEENGPCKECGSNKDLQVDHINPDDKSFVIRWSIAWNKLVIELAKCQVLCKECHTLKSGKEQSIRKQSPLKHGTYSGYIRGCRCDKCRARYSSWKKEYRKRPYEQIV